ncbi:MAG: protein kinase [Halorhabdus sp.]
MADPSDRPDQDPFALLRDVLEAPAAATGSVPALLGLLDAEEPSIRIAGAFGVCLVAVADPDAVSGIVTRLFDRLDGEARAETKIAYDYLVSQFPRRAETAINEAERAVAAGRPLGEERDSVGRVRPPAAGSHDPRTVEPDRNVIDPADPQRNDEATIPQSTGRNEQDRSEDDEPTRRRADSTARQQWNRLYERLSSIVDASRFEDLSVLSGRSRDRYADVSRVLAVESNAERALSLRLFHRPEENRREFVAELGDALTAWQAVSDHPNVVSVFDTGLEPRPWAATDPTVETLADRAVQFEPREALALASDLADGLAHAHQHGVVHGGLDPGNVVLPTAAEDAPRTALLDNVGLLGVYRWYVTPATCLDPRYAAPEYYDRRFGRIDHATDVYHLGSVLYRLLTGRPPFDGPFEDIRESVMHDAPPNPSTDVAVSDDLDHIVTKAMHKRTLGRYETINDLRGDLRRVQGETDGD